MLPFEALRVLRMLSVEVYIHNNRYLGLEVKNSSILKLHSKITPTETQAKMHYNSTSKETLWLLFLAANVTLEPAIVSWLQHRSWYQNVTH